MGPKYAVDHQKNVAKWISEGTFKAQQSVTTGIDNAIKGLLGMLKGENFGKAVLTIEELKVCLDTQDLVTNMLTYAVSVTRQMSKPVVSMDDQWRRLQIPVCLSH